MRIALTALLTAALVASTSLAQLNESTSLAEVDFAHLSEHDPNPLGERALAINPEQWKHAESQHFIYHYAHSYVATPVAIEAEFHYRVAATALGHEQPATETKSHIYIFESPEDWQHFQSAGLLEKWTGGIQSLGSLFVQRNPKYKWTDNSLGHEVVHLVVHRFFPEGVPCWFNEGLAQYISKGAHASYQRARGFIARPQSEAVAPAEMIPLAQLTVMTLPPNDRVTIFYDESERLVRFLAASDKASFLSLLDSLGRHQPLETALGRCYAGKFPTLEVLERDFREYAAKDYGTTMQQASD